MKRHMYRGQRLEGIEPAACLDALRTAAEEAVLRLPVANLSAFAHGNEWFVYYETRGEETVDPEEVFAGAAALLADWPGASQPRRWAPMADIFHYMRPVSDEHWERGRRPERTPYGRVAALKPDEIASYVYYHYQYQEERPGDGDKYGIVGLHENLLFFYSELPATLESAPYEGKLRTALRPDDWAAVMEPHFAKWAEARLDEEIWRRLPLAFEARGRAGRPS